MTSDFCVDALIEAIAQYGAPEIVNTDQGSQFIRNVWTDVLDASTCRISRDGKGHWIDNVFIERLWRSPNTKTFTCAPTRTDANSGPD
jgi:putative transposase